MYDFIRPSILASLQDRDALPFKFRSNYPGIIHYGPSLALLCSPVGITRPDRSITATRPSSARRMV